MTSDSSRRVCYGLCVVLVAWSLAWGRWWGVLVAGWLAFMVWRLAR
jgi:hypothetical protein